MNLIRKALPSVVVIAALVAAPAYAGGNSANAHKCQQDGWRGLTSTPYSTVTSFANVGDCTSYAAHGGILYPLYTGCTDASSCV